MKISIGSDHAGFMLKSDIIKYLDENGMEILDVGTFSTDSVDYPLYAHQVAENIEKGICNVGIVICGSGNGVAMTANKHQTIRCALCWSEEIAVFGRLHNDANMCALPARYLTTETAIDIVKSFLYTNFEGGRHIKRKLDIKNPMSDSYLG